MIYRYSGFQRKNTKLQLCR